MTMSGAGDTQKSEVQADSLPSRVNPCLGGFWNLDLRTLCQPEFLARPWPLPRSPILSTPKLGPVRLESG